MSLRAEDVVFRPYQESDRDAIVNLIAQMWYPDDTAEDALEHAHFELDWHLNHQDHATVAELEDSFAGLIFSRSPKLELASDLADDIAGLKESLGEEHKMIQNIKWLQDEVDAEEHVKIHHPNETAGWLELLMVSPEIRGIGLGKTLFEMGIQHLADNGATHYRLLTDDGCDWKFYEHIQMTRLGAFPDEDDFNIYIYEKEIQH